MDSTSNPAKRILVFMVRGIFSSWKLLLLTNSSVGSSQLTQILLDVFEICLFAGLTTQLFVIKHHKIKKVSKYCKLSKNNLIFL